MSLTACLLAALVSPEAPELTACYPARIVRVIDGDTVVADVSLGWGIVMGEQHIRLRDCWAKEMDEAGGRDARGSLESLLDADDTSPGFQRGAQVILRSGTPTKPGARDKYGRLLGEIFHSGRSVNAEQVRLGHATRTPIPLDPPPRSQ